MTIDIGFPRERIAMAQEQGECLLRNNGQDAFIEPREVAIAVEEHRWAWRPKHVRLILIAESHVHTSCDDFECRMRPHLLPPEAQLAPQDFVRLVYCLGYGQSSLLSRVTVQKNPGTWQFWNIFGRLAGTGKQPPAGKKTPEALQQLLSWKVNTLLTLQAKGIWLLDSSLHAIYSPKGVRLLPTIASELHKEWWTSYGRWVVESYPEAHVWAIGKGIFGTLKDLGCRVDDWVYLPTAFGKGVNHERNWPGLDRVAKSL